MESFVDFWVGIPDFAGDMKLIFICFALLTNVVLSGFVFATLSCNVTYSEVAGRNGDHRMC